ncbi:MAG: ribosome maturation factor RimM [Christensenellales bacterium]
MEKIEIGQIVKSQGLSGEVKVKPYADEKVFQNIDYVYLGDADKKINIIKSTFRLGFAFLTFEGVDDRTKADAIRGKELLIDKQDLVVDEDEFIIDDLIKMRVYLSNGEDYGEIILVEQYGSADIITINGKFGKWQVPLIADLVESIDKANKVMVLNAKRFDEVKV